MSEPAAITKIHLEVPTSLFEAMQSECVFLGKTPEEVAVWWLEMAAEDAWTSRPVHAALRPDRIYVGMGPTACKPALGPGEALRFIGSAHHAWPEQITCDACRAEIATWT